MTRTQKRKYDEINTTLPNEACTPLPASRNLPLRFPHSPAYPLCVRPSLFSFLRRVPVLHFEPRALAQGDAATVALEHEREQATKVAPSPGAGC